MGWVGVLARGACLASRGALLFLLRGFVPGRACLGSAGPKAFVQVLGLGSGRVKLGGASRRERSRQFRVGDRVAVRRERSRLAYFGDRVAVGGRASRAAPPATNYARLQRHCTVLS